MSVDVYQLHILPSVDGLNEHSPIVDDAVDDFREDVRGSHEIELVQDNSAPQSNSKGTFETIIVGLGGPAGIAASAAALARIMRLWLERDRDRSLTIKLPGAKGSENAIKISGEKVSNDAILKAVERVLDSRGKRN